MGGEDGKREVEAAVDADSNQGNNDSFDEVKVVMGDFSFEEKVASSNDTTYSNGKPSQSSEVTPVENRLEGVAMSVFPDGFKFTLPIFEVEGYEVGEGAWSDSVPVGFVGIGGEVHHEFHHLEATIDGAGLTRVFDVFKHVLET